MEGYTLNKGWYIFFLICVIVFITLLAVYFSRSDDSESGGGGGGGGGGVFTGVSSGFTDPAKMTISKVTDKIITFSERLKFEVVRNRTELNMFLYDAGSNIIAQKRRIRVPTDDTKDLDVSTFTLVDGSGSRFTKFTEGLKYYIQFIFNSSDTSIEDKAYSFEFTAPVKIQFGTPTEYQLPSDASKGQMIWTWNVKDKIMIAKYRRISSTIPWFGGDADFDDDISPYIPSTATYMLVKPNELYYRLSDEKLVDAYDNETETPNDISGSSLITYSV